MKYTYSGRVTGINEHITYPVGEPTGREIRSTIEFNTKPEQRYAASAQFSVPGSFPIGTPVTVTVEVQDAPTA
jgi:hypothetical protein